MGEEDDERITLVFPILQVEWKQNQMSRQNWVVVSSDASDYCSMAFEMVFF